MNEPMAIMPKMTLRPHQLRVELEVTPDWWSCFGAKELGIKNPHAADLLARSMLIATGMFESSEVRLSRSYFKLIVFIPSDSTFATVSEKAGALRDKLNALENPGSQG